MNPVTAEMIEKAVVDFFTEGKRFAHVEIGREPPALSKPGINVAVVSGSFKGAGCALKLEVSHKILLVLVVRNVRNESERRKVVHPLIHYVVQRLWGETLGLAIKPFEGFAWDETTTPDQLADGICAVEITAETASELRKIPTQDAEVELVEILGIIAASQDASVEGRVQLQENP